jgi:hypothetical protein
MRINSNGQAVLLMWVLCAPAFAGITVTSYQTTAETNGFAPSLQGPYLARQSLENITPALAQVSGDWTGPNEDGTPDTWHYVGTSQASSTTTFDASSYQVTAAGSFAYTLDTTAEFVDPQPSVFAPGGVGNYNGFFTVGQSAVFSITATLNRLGRVRLNPIGGGPVVFDQTNVTDVPISIHFSGTITPGQYRVLLTAGLAAPNFPNGVNHFTAEGSYQDVVFTVQVPEPNALGVVISIIGARVRRRRPSA